MNGRYLLDTNIIIGLFASEVSIMNNLAQTDEIFIPIKRSSIEDNNFFEEQWRNGLPL
jgi:hypothetical protein